MVCDNGDNKIWLVRVNRIREKYREHHKMRPNKATQHHFNDENMSTKHAQITQFAKAKNIICKRSLVLDTWPHWYGNLITVGCLKKSANRDTVVNNLHVNRYTRLLQVTTASANSLEKFL